MFSFLGKGKPRAAGSPAQRVASLSSQGLSEAEIITALRKEGYSPKDVDSAMKEALRSAATATPLRLPPREQFAAETPYSRGVPEPEEPPAPQDYGRGEGLPPAPRSAFGAAPRPLSPREAQRPPLPPLDDLDDEPLPGELDMPEIPGARRAIEPRSRPPALQAAPEDDLDELEPLPLPRSPGSAMKKHQELEEMAEGVVEEKWTEFEREIRELKDDFKSLESKVASLEQQLREVKGSKTGESDDIKVRLDAYRQSITEVNTRLEGMERAVKDSLTPMMQTMRSLTEALRTAKS